MFHTSAYLEPNTEYHIKCSWYAENQGDNVFPVGMESKTLISVKGVQFSIGPSSLCLENLGDVDGLEELDFSKCSIIRGLIFSF